MWHVIRTPGRAYVLTQDERSAQHHLKAGELIGRRETMTEAKVLLENDQARRAGDDEFMKLTRSSPLMVEVLDDGEAY